MTLLIGGRAIRDSNGGEKCGGGASRVAANDMRASPVDDFETSTTHRYALRRARTARF